MRYTGGKTTHIILLSLKQMEWLNNKKSVTDKRVIFMFFFYHSVDIGHRTFGDNIMTLDRMQFHINLDMT